ncbi:translocon-associated protein delta isoform X2 [Brevipalpus obovatus]|uniref:translocon-associated protein delta isoform X2 n=1 Tax=Brevipalpus obovatus TaxID=246614 RepID=UPI003D9EC797
MFIKLNIASLLLLSLNLVHGCQIGDVQSHSYTTTDGLVIAETAYISVFNVACKDDKLNLFADMGDKIVPVTKSADGRTFQVSWVKPLDKSYSKTYEIKVYDEEGYSQLKRAQRSNTDAGVNPLFKIDLRHPGTYKGPWLQSERVAAVASILVCYLAFKQKFGFN